MACDLVGINNREPRGENHRGMPCRSGGTRWARRCLLAVPNVHVGDSWTALDQVGAKGTPRPVTCDLARKSGCARSAFVQTALAVLLRQPCRPVGQMLYQDPASHSRSKILSTARILAKGSLWTCRPAAPRARRRWAWHRFGQARIGAAEKLQTKDSLSDMK